MVRLGGTATATTVILIVATADVPPGPFAVKVMLSLPLYPALGVYCKVKPLTEAEPWLGVETSVKLVALPVIVGAIELLLLLADTVTLEPLTVGAGGVITMLKLAAEELPPGPVAMTEKLSLPL